MREAEGWVLEVERLVPMGGGVLRPMQRRITGRQAILAEVGERAEQTAALMDRAPNLPSCYETQGGTWRPRVPTVVPAAPDNAEPLPTLMDRLARGPHPETVAARRPSPLPGQRWPRR
jgi:hypothetical protein